jgi:aerotaxis receptor
MDFDSAIQAHTNWKLKLFNYCRGKLTEKIDLQTLRLDNACALGKWLHGEGRRYGTDAQFKKLLETHAGFHACAASVARMVEQGQAPQAESLLNSPQSEFNRLSLGVVGILMDLRRKHSTA